MRSCRCPPEVSSRITTGPSMPATKHLKLAWSATRVPMALATIPAIPTSTISRSFGSIAGSSTAAPTPQDSPCRRTNARVPVNIHRSPCAKPATERCQAALATVTSDDHHQPDDRPRPQARVLKCKGDQQNQKQVAQKYQRAVAVQSGSKGPCEIVVHLGSQSHRSMRTRAGDSCRSLSPVELGFDDASVTVGADTVAELRLRAVLDVELD